MPRMKILNQRRGARCFDFPPIFNSVERKRCFDFSHAAPGPFATSLRTGKQSVGLFS